MSAVPSNTGGLGAHDGAPPAGPHPNASPPRHREGGMVDYRGPAPETPSPTFHGLTDRNEAIGLIHLQRFIPWQWGPITAVGEVVPDPLQQLAKLSNCWVVTIMHSDPFKVRRPQHACYWNRAFYEMPHGGWLVFDLCTSRRVEIELRFLEDFQDQDPTGIGSIDWPREFPAWIPRAAAGTPSGGPPRSQQSGRRAPANTRQQSRPQTADTAEPRRQLARTPMPPPPLPNRIGQQQSGLVQQNSQQANASRSPWFASSQVSQDPVQLQVPFMPPFAQTEAAGYFNYPSSSSAYGGFEPSSTQWTPAPPTAYTASYNQWSTLPSLEGEDVVDLRNLAGSPSQSSRSPVGPPSRPLRTPVAVYMSGALPPPESPRISVSPFPQLPSHISSRTVVSSPQPSPSQFTGGQADPLTFKACPRATPSINQRVLQPRPTHPGALIAPHLPSQSFQQQNPSGSKKRKGAPSSEDNSGDREARRVKLTQGEDSSGDVQILDAAPSVFQTPRATSRLGNAAAEAKAREGEVQVESLNALPREEKCRLLQEFRVRNERKEAAKRGQNAQQPPRILQDHPTSSGAPRFQATQSSEPGQHEQSDRSVQRDVMGDMRRPSTHSTIGRPLPQKSSGPSSSISRTQGPVSNANERAQWIEPSHHVNAPQGVRVLGVATFHGGELQRAEDSTRMPSAAATTARNSRNATQERGYYEVASRAGNKRQREDEAISTRTEKRQRPEELPHLAGTRRPSNGLEHPARADTARTNDGRISNGSRGSGSPGSWNGGIGGSQSFNPPAASRIRNMEPERPLPQTADPQAYNVRMPLTSNMGPANGSANDAMANIQLDAETTAWLEGLPDLETLMQWDLTDLELLNSRPTAP
ncbi:MAG: hypothetical protein LQ352_007800 [Teloschistes flavicans]|nr:MAG: hypothetical protein LQ352_007800 [Teloschistes flavicans]